MASFRRVPSLTGKPIGSDFVLECSRPRKVWCSECGKPITQGVPALISVRGGKVQKRVCSEECRLDFDARFWQGVAMRRKR